MSPPKPLRTVARALSVFDCFGSDRPQLTLGEIAEAIGLAKSTTFRLVQTLELLGFLTRQGVSYALSDKFLALAAAVRSSADMREIAQPVLERLAAQTGEAITLHALVDRQRVCIATVNVTPGQTDVNQPGERRPLGLGGASLVLMAFQDAATLAGILPLAAKTAGCSRKELASIIGHVREQGYATSHGGGARGLSGIAAPIFDAQGRVRYAVAVLIPKGRARGRVAAVAKQVTDAAAEISTRLLA